MASLNDAYNGLLTPGRQYTQADNQQLTFSQRNPWEHSNQAQQQQQQQGWQQSGGLAEHPRAMYTSPVTPTRVTEQQAVAQIANQHRFHPSELVSLVQLGHQVPNDGYYHFIRRTNRAEYVYPMQV